MILTGNGRSNQNKDVTMRVLVLDPAESTGYCILIIEDDFSSAEIIKYGFIDVNTTSNFQGDHCLDLMSRLAFLITQYQIDHIAVEDYFFSQRFANGSNVNASYRTAIHILARQLKIDYTILNISAWKSFVAGKSVPSKEQKTKWGKEAAKKLYIQQALWERWNFKFPNHSLSEKTGKPILFRFDIVDVVGQAVYFACLLNRVKNISMNIPIPKDVQFKKINKKQFIYP